MEVFSTYYDKAPELNKDTYTFVRVSCMASPEWFSEQAGEYVELSGTFGPTPAMLAVGEEEAAKAELQTGSLSWLR